MHGEGEMSETGVRLEFHHVIKLWTSFKGM